MAKRVTEQEKEKMWQLYQKYGSFSKVAKLIKRDRSTVARYVSEFEASVRMARALSKVSKDNCFNESFRKETL